MSLITNTELELLVLIVVVLGLIGACWSAAGMSGIYDSIGRGYLDVSASDQPAGATPEDELADAHELWEATAALRRARGETVVSTEERLEALRKEFGEAA